jgi:NAD(P)-dependent dehydrogenase (short-subunit alcohol dehydrogenase family)
MSTAVVTGAGSGIGRACARALGSRGLHVVAVGRRRAPLEETVAEIGSAEAVTADISRDEGIAAVAAAVADRRVAAVVHAAGRESLTPLERTTRAELESVSR